MDFPPLHRWDLTEAEAVALQKDLAGRVDVTAALANYDLVAGADVSYNRYSTTFYAAVVVLRRSDWAVVETAGAVGEGTFPYIPGLLSFREAPVLLKAFERLEHRPDVVMIDGQGIAHPRRLGIASHLGLWLRLPTIGCAKSKLTGRYTDPGPNPGAQAPLLAGKQEVIGTVLRTKARSNPLFISPGHLIDLASSVRLVQEACRGYRLPEPTRQAHLQVNEIRRAGSE